MDPDKDNANPTVLDASQLPTRRRQKVVDEAEDGEAEAARHARREKSAIPGGTGLFDDLVTPYKRIDFTADPFASGGGLDNGDGDGDVVDDDHIGEDGTVDSIDELEIYDLISTISDPEHPLSLGSLAVVNLDGIKLCTRPMGGSTDTLRDRNSPLGAKKAITTVVVEVTPTIAHCSLATVIGLGVRVRLEQALPPRFRVLVRIKPGSHASAETVSKQLADKERVAAALENDNLRTVVRRMLATCA